MPSGFEKLFFIDLLILISVGGGRAATTLTTKAQRRAHTHTRGGEPRHLYIDFPLANQLLSRGCGDSLTHEARLAVHSHVHTRARTFKEGTMLQP